MRLHRLSLFVGAAAGALAVMFASSLGFGVKPLAAEEDLHAAVQKTQVMAVTYQLDTSGFHDLDEKLNVGEMVSGALGRVRRARIATQATDWPHDLKEPAAKLVGEMMHLEEELRDENVSKAAPHAHEVHELAHDISNQVYAWLTGAAPPADHHP